jgi:hypothetical protein
MNTRSMPNRAWRKPGITTTVILLALTALRHGKAAEINYTITGVLTGGWDQLGVFATGKEAQNMAGKPFTLVFTFDDSKGNRHSDRESSSLSGEGPDSGGKAALTINGTSFTFGGEKYSSWSVYRSPGLIAISVSEKKGSFFNIAPAVDVRIMPQNGSARFNPDWKAPLSTTRIDNQTSCFFIARHDAPNREVKGCFDVKKVEVSGKSWWPW